MTGVPRDLRDAVRGCVARGWILERRKKHFMLKAPNGRAVTISGTPSDHRSIANTIAQIRRCASGGPLHGHAAA